MGKKSSGAEVKEVKEPRARKGRAAAKISLNGNGQSLSTASVQDEAPRSLRPEPLRLLNPEVNLLHALQEHFGFDHFKGEQERAIRSIIAGNDTFVIMPTGGGKSLCYQLPALLAEGTAIIISPLIALMKNQVDAIRGYSTRDAVAHFLNSTLTKQQQRQVKKDLMEGHTKMLYVAPETLTKEENIRFLSEQKISFVAVDEAHCISEWGHDFRPEYRKIKSMVEAMGHRIPIMALTATATPKVQSDIIKNLGMINPTVLIASFNRPNLYYEVRPKVKRDLALKEIVRFIKNHPGSSGIIYVLSRKTTEEIAEYLTVNGIRAAAYHAGLEAAVRSQRQDQFLHEEIDVIVATIAFGMGIDKPDVRFVIHWNMPKSLENYYQETGRAGRDGLLAKCIAYYNYHDIEKLEKFMRDKTQNERELGGHLLMETVAYAETSVCRRKFLIHYFGQRYEEDNCGNCDNCLHPKEQLEGKQYLQDLLRVVDAIHESFPIDYVVDILCGNKHNQVTMFRHDELEVFGIGKDHDSHFWNSVLRQALLHDLLFKDIENYGVIRISEKGRQFLKKPYSIPISINHDFDNLEDAEPEGGTGALDPQLLAMLKDLRKSEADRLKLAPYILFQDPSLEEMATMYPTSLDELMRITGVSRGKAEKFGRPFVELIKRYVEENEIEKPSELVVRSVVNKSANKIYIIQNVDKRIPLETIAQAKNMSMAELIQEMESIVASGTRLNLDYYINELIDKERQQEVFEYFRTAASDSVEEAVNALGKENYTYEEIQLLRLKFLSEIAH
ncbi:MAG: DNA helicase RecQ [Chitinophagales bacterium]|nr:DNA helicase RecQ [Chitinophagales bacterium]MDW8427153.1 DNA helicase RecQ [Chitinophagales bacterium]